MSKNQNNEELMKLVLEKLGTVEEKLDRKFDVIDSRLNSMDKTLVKQEANLAEHMRRTDLLEKDVAPIKKHVHHVEGGLKLVGIISVVVGIVVGIAKILGH